MFTHILVTLDGSRLAEQALPPALELAGTFHADVTLLRVINPMLKTTRAGAAAPAALEVVEKQLLDMAQDYLTEVAARLRAAHDIPIHTVVQLGTPYKQIVRYTEENPVDLLVISTRGETGLTRWLMGSVTDNVIRGVTIPVMVIPAASDDPPDAD